MRHRVYGKHLGRDKDERDNLFKGLLKSLFTYGTIQTSEAKAKSVKGLVDKVINLSKDKKRQYLLKSFLVDKNLRERLIKDVVPRLGSRTSGYTSLVKVGTRFGDQTMMVKMSIIGAEELKPVEKVTGNRLQGTVKKTGTKKPISEKKGRVGQSVSKTTSKRRTAK